MEFVSPVAVGSVFIPPILAIVGASLAVRAWNTGQRDRARVLAVAAVAAVALTLWTWSSFTFPID